MIDWRGQRIRVRAEPVPPRVNPITRRPLCVHCGTPIGHLTRAARFCSHRCRNRWHAEHR